MSGTTENSPSQGNNKANQVQPYYQAENNQSTSKQFLNKSTSTTDSFRGQQNGKTTKENTSFPNLCANFTAYMTKNTVNVSINNRKSSALCDTGASVSCISKQFFDKAFLKDKPNINPCHVKYIIGVRGTNHQVLGVVEINVNFGTLGLTYPFYVVEELHHSIILGHDFLEAHSVTLDIRGKKMIIQDHVKVCSLQTNTGYARTVKSINLPANSEIDVQVKIARVNTSDEVLLEPLARLANENLLGAKCLVKVNKGKSVMRLINPTETNIQIKGSKVLAIVSQVEKANIFMLDDGQTDQTETTKEN